MSLVRLRRSSRAVAAILLLASMWQLPHRSQDDDICAPPGTEAHDESKHVYTTPSAAAHQDHCAICHWTRFMKPAFSAGPAVVANHGKSGDLVPVSSFLLRDPSTDRLPARAPPAL